MIGLLVVWVRERIVNDYYRNKMCTQVYKLNNSLVMASATLWADAATHRVMTPQPNGHRVTDTTASPNEEVMMRSMYAMTISPGFGRRKNAYLLPKISA